MIMETFVDICYYAFWVVCIIGLAYVCYKTDQEKDKTTD